MLFSLIQLAIQNLMYLALHLERGSNFPQKLSKEEERECLERISKGDIEARNKLVEHNLRLVAYIAKKNQSETVDQEDLISIGSFGLIKAAESFDIEKNFNFSTYASRCIDNEIKMYFRKTKREQNEVLINEPLDPEGDGLTLADVFSDPLDIEIAIEMRIDLQKLHKYINEILTKRERQIICMRYGLVRLRDGKIEAEKTKTQQDIANILGISRPYISRIEKKALEKLKAAFQTEAMMN